MNKLPKVSRVEVINHAVAEDNANYGRAYAYYAGKPIEVSYDLQNDGKTLKVFIEKKTVNNELPDCTGCIKGRHGMVTHQMGTKQHPTVVRGSLENLKEEARKEFDELAHALYETSKNDYWSAIELGQSLLSSSIEKAFAAGEKEGKRKWSVYGSSGSSGRDAEIYEKAFAAGKEEERLSVIKEIEDAEKSYLIQKVYYEDSPVLKASFESRRSTFMVILEKLRARTNKSLD